MFKKSLKSVLIFTIALVGFATATTVQAAPNVIDFELEIDLKDQTKYDLEYEVKGNFFEAKYQVPASPVLYGQNAKAKVEDFIKQLNVSPSSDKKALKEQTITLLKVDPNNIEEFELEIKFDDGQKIEIDN